MTFTIDKTSSDTVSLILMYSPASFQECLIHSMDAWRKAGDLANNGDFSTAASYLLYAGSKSKMAIHLADNCPHDRGAKAAIDEAEIILWLIEKSRDTAKAFAS